MRQKNDRFYFSATDLAGYINCRHLTTLNKKAALKELTKPVQESRLLETLQQRGDEFEQAFLKELKMAGKSVVEIDRSSASPFQDTVTAMQSGADVIFQARMEMNDWQGWSDFLMRVDKPSQLGNWSYEVYDTKLTTHTKAGTILQITMYSEIIATIQGLMPEFMYVKHPGGFEQYRVMDYDAYYRLIKRKFLEAVQGPGDSYPDPVSHCDICAWWTHCNKQRRTDDHLGFVAGLGSAQLRELRAQGVNTLEALASLPLPLPFRPNRGALVTYEKLREQARLQREVREQQRPVYELLPRIPELGFFKLPEPNEDDIFLDLEGDPLVSPNGREYIFGYLYKGVYTIHWAETEAEEKAAFETFMDLAIDCYQRSPAMHIFHFGAYETSAFKRLMLKYATRIEEMDSLLRSKTFTDLHLILRHSVRAGVERYSLKDLEKYHGFIREADLRTVGPVKAEYEMLLETSRLSEATADMRTVIQTYNEDDCRSTEALFRWLCSLREGLRAQGEDIPAPEKPSGDPSEKMTRHQELVRPIFNALLEGLPADRSTFTPLQLANYLVAHLLDWYGREDKKLFWDMFRLEEATEEELLDDPAALYGLKYTVERKVVKSAVIDTYEYPRQEVDLREGDRLRLQTVSLFMDLVEIDRDHRLIRVKKTNLVVDLHPDAVFRFNQFRHDAKIANIVQIGLELLEFELDNPAFQCGLDLLVRNKPRVSSPVTGDKETYAGRLEWLLKLDCGVLPIQGPPGTGKTYTASHLILDLVKAGKKIGITALGHKVITHLLTSIHQLAEQEGYPIGILQKPDTKSEAVVPWITVKDYGSLHKKLQKAHVVAGTSTFWANGALREAVDYLFVEEAGQLSLIDTLVCCYATRNLVLIGDPQQLRQPVQGVHPDGVDVSALEHIFQGQQTIGPDQGIFLGTTWRMHPKICAFNSDLYYNSRLHPVAGLERQRITGNTAFAGSGLFYQPVVHQGNTTFSQEEVTEVVRVFKELTKGDVFWEDAAGKRVKVNASHIRIITPYNSQRYEISRQLGGFQEVGTVDKFQGQEAPIVIYSMVTSSAEDAPRGMDFLYSPNRFNVAVSRARAVFILIGSSRLFEPECKSPEQMRLANGVCCFGERVDKI